jgi:crotonobetainyl-CoA:carnitine CoA-transferase CaiB-like acyl-CoA transferase
MLEAYRVLDLTDDRGHLASYILAMLGADVILVEPPDGSSARRCGPFAGDRPDPDRSLTFWAWNRGKRSVVIDTTTPEGQRQLARLAADADVLFESGAYPIDVESLRAANPGLVTVSISPFGGQGPKAHWPATDLTVLAAGGQLSITGDADRPPVRTIVPQAFLHACTDAASGALLALTERAESGLGQHVDISAQRSILQATQSYVLATLLGGTPAQRTSGGVRTGGLDIQLLWPCKDGYACITFLFGASMGPFTRRLMEWMHEEGYCDDATRDKDWLDYANQLFDGREPVEEYERLKQIVAAFCMDKTKADLLDGARLRNLLVAPIATPDEVINSPQYEFRDFWDHVDDPLLSNRTVQAPGSVVHSTLNPRVRLDRPPRLGEHSDEVLGEPALSAGNGHRPTVPAAARRLPLEGLKVLDLTWAMAGPATTRAMADYGATVIRVESTTHLDVARTVGPFCNDVPGTDSSGLLFNMSVGKRGIALDLRAPESRPVLEDLIRWADVMMESFSPRGHALLGLDYEHIVEINPNLIMMSSCLFGQSGPLQRCAGFGTTGAALAGFYHLTGWPDRPPCGPFGAYSDYPSPRFALCVLLAALDERRRTGRGQYFDFAQAEAAMHFLTPALLDHHLNGTDVTRRGNDDLDMSPHAVYPSAGDDRWIAVACRNDDDWGRLAHVLGRADLAALTLDERRDRKDELDRLIATWTAGHSPEDGEAALIGAGVPAHGVQNAGECAADEQLLSVDHFVTVPHSEHGTVVVEGSRMRLSATPARLESGPPLLGQDTVGVLMEVLGYDDERLGELFAVGALD